MSQTTETKPDQNAAGNGSTRSTRLASADVARHLAAGAAGGLAAGALLSVLMLAQERATSETSELVKLERKTEGKMGVDHRPVPAPGTLPERLAAHGGHLALSALAGIVYQTALRDGRSPAAAGLAFGMSFYALAYGMVGPALGVTPPPWREQRANLAQRGLMHALFGVATATVADRIAKRL